MTGRTRGATAVELSAEALLREAAAREGRDRWGDRSFLDPMRLLLDSAELTGDLSDHGRSVLRSVVLRHLRERLHIQDHLDRRPDAARRVLGSPVVITGLPRTGTSLLHNLLAQDPRHRVLRVWEGLHPADAADADGPTVATLVGRADRWVRRFYERVPDFRSVRSLTAEGPEECDALLQNGFASQHFEDMFDARAYSHWFHLGDLTREYRYYALQLRMLSGDLRGRRWVLKSPGHLGHLDELLRVLPDARILHCHRDPVDVVGSYASLIRTVRTPNAREVADEVVGEQALRRCSATILRALRSRAAGAEERVLDVSYPALVADPVGTVRAIYAWLELPLSERVAEAIRRWPEEHPPHRHGRHRYSLEEFGLSADRVRAVLRSYRERFASLLGG